VPQASSRRGDPSPSGGHESSRRQIRGRCIPSLEQAAALRIIDAVGPQPRLLPPRPPPASRPARSRGAKARDADCHSCLDAKGYLHHGGLEGRRAGAARLCSRKASALCLALLGGPPPALEGVASSHAVVR
jgi:hypothetical protein